MYKIKKPAFAGLRRGKPELLLPAGDLRKMEYAFAYGADAVYLGLPSFSLRAKTGFDMKSIKDGIKYAHKLKKKVYITVNIFAHNRQMKLLPDFLQKLGRLSPDAIIASDPGVVMMVKKLLPKTAIHLSTQANTLNSEAVRFWQKQGVSRIILGRETSLKDIQEIHKAVPKMEFEIFVHGAMCMSYSGRCYLSAWFNGRSANEGLCTQPCRWEYKVYPALLDEDDKLIAFLNSAGIKKELVVGKKIKCGVYLEEPLRPGQMIPVEADGKGTYIMNSKDLCLIDYIPELIKAGACSFKIEGRTKSIYYLATTAKAYRRAIDVCGDKKVRNKSVILAEAKADLQKIDNRDYTTGFLIGNEEMTCQKFSSSKAVSDWQFVGEVVEARKHKNTETQKQDIFIRAHNTLRLGDGVELVTPDNCYTIKIDKLFNQKGEEVVEIHGGTEEIYSFVVDSGLVVPERSILRKKITNPKLQITNKHQ